MMWVGNLLQPSLINLSNAEAFLVCLSVQLVKFWMWRARQYLWEIPHEFMFMMCSQSCPALCNPTDYSPPGSSVHGISQARILGRPFLLQRIFPTQGLNPCLLCLLHWQANSLSTVPLGKPWPLPFRILLPHPQPTLGAYFPSLIFWASRPRLAPKNLACPAFSGWAVQDKLWLRTKPHACYLPTKGPSYCLRASAPQPTTWLGSI